MGLRIYNTQTREKVDFVPLVAGKVGLYLCGVTSYAPAHIGHARMFVAFDVVCRWLKQTYALTFVRNYTDVDDKIIRAANAEGVDPAALASRYIDHCAADLDALGCIKPDVEPRVTTHMAEIIAMVETLEAKGLAYAVDGDVYFEVKKFAAYGSLSGRTLEDLEAGARVEVDPRKRSPNDFALWKSAKPGEPSWSSPWGPGRPGWHIECSAMSGAYLGQVFDIHGGGKDLVFPHHENELAQSCGAHGTDELARVWMHNGFVNLLPEACPSCAMAVEGDLPAACPGCGYVYTEDDLKMSKSRGNYYPVREVIEQYEPESLRLLLLGSHYRTPIQFSHALIADAEKRLDRHYQALCGIDAFIEDATSTPGDSLEKTFDLACEASVIEAMNDDFNTAKALADIGELFKIANDLIHFKEKERIGRKLKQPDRSRLLGELRQAIARYSQIFGLWTHDPQAYLGRRKHKHAASVGLDETQIAGYIERRAAARAGKDWAAADEIRDELKGKGIVLLDGKDGTTWEISCD